MSLIFRQMTSIEGKVVECWVELISSVLCLSLFLVCVYFSFKTSGTGVLHLIQINHQPEATIFQFIILTFVYSSICFGRFPPIIRSSMTAVAASVFVVGPAGPRTQHGYHHDTKVKPEAATAVIELLIMGGRTPETCWAVNKRQDNKLENCCVWLVIYLNCTTMHVLTNFKMTYRVW